MSRIGKQPVVVPDKVNVNIDMGNVIVKGPKGELNYLVSKKINIERKENKIFLTPVNASRECRQLWGLSRTLIHNMILGVTEGFSKKLEFVGVGYKANVSGTNLTMNFGYSHPIVYEIPKDVTITTKGNNIEVSGCSKELVGFVAAKIRNYRPPEPYKGKGVKYAGEHIIRKAGKTGVKK